MCSLDIDVTRPPMIAAATVYDVQCSLLRAAYMPVILLLGAPGK